MTIQAALQELVDVEQALTNAPDEFDEWAAELRKKRRNILAFLGMPEARTARKKTEEGRATLMASKEKNALIFYVEFADPEDNIMEMFNNMKNEL